MPIYITQGHYTRDAISGMIAAPEDRSKALKKLVDAAGGKLLSWYLTFGEYDFVAISEFPDETAAAGAVLAAAAGGGVTDLKTALAMTGPDAMKAFGKAGELAPSFTSAGKGKSGAGASGARAQTSVGSTGGRKR
jgi:uncharacterized protein with GYD domain